MQIMLHMLRKTGQVLFHTRAGAHAHQVAQAFLRSFETSPTLWDQTHRQEWSAAVDQLLKVIEHTSSPELLACFYDHCGWGYLRLRESQQGLIWHERALALHSHSAPIRNGLGNTYYFLKNYHQALKHFNTAIQLAPHHPHPYSGRGRTYSRLKAYQQALSDFDQALQLDWKHVNFYNNQGRICLQLKDYQQALSHWDRLLEVAPEDPRAGAVQFQRGSAPIRDELAL